jgi:hypothetical protein
MNKKDLKNLREVAAKMPPYYQTTWVRRTVAEILADDPSANNNGEPFNPEMTYLQQMQMPVNHYLAMKKLLKSGGIEKVKEYISEMAKVEHNVVNGQASLLVGMEERAKNFKI